MKQGSTTYAIEMMESLNNSVGKTQSSMNKVSDISQDINKNMSKNIKKTDEVEKTSLAWGKAKQGINKVTKDIWSNLKGILGTIGAIFSVGGLISAVKDFMMLNQSITETSYRMGHMGENVEELRAGMLNVQQATGMAQEGVSKLYNTLMELRVPQEEIHTLAENTARFSKITGLGEEAAARLTGELSRTGNMGEKAISGLMVNMVNVQREFGMAEGSMNQLSDGIIKTTQYLSNMGKSASEIESFQEGTIKLAAAFEDVGIEASKATELIDNLLDPGKIEDNALLYSQLGISMGDAISGNINPEEIAQGLKQIGGQLEHMGGPAGAAFAKQMGMSYRELQQMSNMDISQIEDQFGGAGNSSEELAAAQEDITTGVRRWEEGINRVKARVGEVIHNLLPVMESIMGKVSGIVESLSTKFSEIGQSPMIRGLLSFMKSTFENIIGMFSNPAVLIAGFLAIFGIIRSIRRRLYGLNNVGEDVSNGFKSASPVIEKAVSSAISMGSEKGASVMAEKMKQKARELSPKVREEIEDNLDFKMFNRKAELFDKKSTENVFGIAKKLSEQAAHLNRKKTEGVKLESSSIKFTTKLAEKQLEKLNLDKIEVENMKNMLDAQKDALQADEEIYKKRLESIEEQKQQQEKLLTAEKNKNKWTEGELQARLAEVNASYEKEIEMNKSAKDKIKKERKNLTAELTTNDTRRSEVIEKNLNKMNKMAIQSLIDQNEAKRKNHLEEINRIEREKKENKDKIDAEEANLASVRKQLTQLQGIEGTDIFSEEAMDLFYKETKIKVDLSNLESVNDYLKQQSVFNEVNQEEIRKTVKTYSGMQSTLNELNAIDKERNEELTNQNELLENQRKEQESLLKARGTGSSKSTGEEMKSAAKNFVSGVIGLGLGTKLGNSIQTSVEASKEILESVKFKGITNSLRAASGESNNAGVGLLKTVGKATKGVFSLAGKATSRIWKGASKAASVVSKGISSAVGIAAKGMRMVAGPLMALLAVGFSKSDKAQEALGKIQDALGKVMDELGPLLGELFDTIGNTLDDVISNVMPLITNLLNFLMPIISDLITTISEIFGDLFEGEDNPIAELSETFKNIGPVLGDALKSIGGLIGDLIPIFMDHLVMLIDIIVENILPLFLTLIDVVGILLKALLPAIGKIIKALLPLLITLIEFLLPPLLFIIGLLIGALGGVVKAIGWMVSKIPGMGSVGDALMKSGDAMLEASGEIMAGAMAMNDSNEKLTREMVENRKQLRENNLKQENATRMTDTLSNALGTSAEETRNMTTEQLVMSVKDSGSRTQLRDAVIKNANATLEMVNENNEEELELRMQEMLDESLAMQNDVRSAFGSGDPSQEIGNLLRGEAELRERVRGRSISLEEAQNQVLRERAEASLGSAMDSEAIQERLDEIMDGDNINLKADQIHSLTKGWGRGNAVEIIERELEERNRHLRENAEEILREWNEEALEEKFLQDLINSVENVDDLDDLKRELGEEKYENVLEAAEEFAKATVEQDSTAQNKVLNEQREFMGMLIRGQMQAVQETADNTGETADNTGEDEEDEYQYPILNATNRGVELEMRAQQNAETSAETQGRILEVSRSQAEMQRVQVSLLRQFVSNQETDSEKRERAQAILNELYENEISNSQAARRMASLME